MIARISTGGSVGGAVGYNEDKVESGEAERIGCVNLVDEDMPTGIAVNIMEMMCSQNTRVKNNVFSCSLNLNHEDLQNIDEKVLQNGCKDENELYHRMADMYMQKMGYGNQPYLIYKHKDIERTHIHIVSVRVDENGDKINNNFERRRSQDARMAVNKAFDLSTLGETKGKVLTQEDIDHKARRSNDYVARVKAGIADTMVKPGSADLAHIIRQVLGDVERFHPKNMKEFNKDLAQYGITCVETHGEDCHGRAYAGCQFGVIARNEQGQTEIVSHLIKGSALGSQYSLGGLERTFNLNANNPDLRKSDEISKKYIRESIDNYISAPTKVSFEGLCEHLQEKGIHAELQFDKVDTHKVNGVTFLDNVNGSTFNGSQIGKPYSLNRIMEAINKHNDKCDEAEQQQMELMRYTVIKPNSSPFIPKDDYKKGMDLLKTTLNEERKGVFFYESDAIRYIDQFNEIFRMRLEKEGCYNSKQVDSLISNFTKSKKAELQQVEFKEDKVAQDRIIAAVNYSQYVPSLQDKADLLAMCGVRVAKENDTLVFSPMREEKQHIRLDLTQISGLLSNVSADKVPFDLADVKAKENLTPISKVERNFINSFTYADVLFKGGDFSRIGSMLDKNLQKEFVKHLVLPKEELKSSVNALSDFSVNLSIKKGYKFWSDFAADFAEYKDSYIDFLRKNGKNEMQAECVFNVCKNSLSSNLPSLIEKDRNKCKDLMLSASVFAINIKEPSDRSEFLMRMGINAKVDRGVLTLSMADKPEFNVTWEELMTKNKNLTLQNQLFMQSVIPPTHPDAKLFTYRERSFVQTFSQNSWKKDNVDSRNAAAMSYLNDDKYNEVCRKALNARIGNIIDRNPDAPASKTVEALITRGIVIKPFKSQTNEIVYYAKMHDADDKCLVPLPKEINQRLNESNYIPNFYRNIDAYIKDGHMNCNKMTTLEMITRAADYRDPQLLQKSIDFVTSRNAKLGEAMKDAAANMLAPDYECVAKLVLNYKGEKNITLPPPTQKENSFVYANDPTYEAAQYRNLTEIMNSGITFMELMEYKANVHERLSQSKHKDYSHDADNTTNQSKGMKM